MFFNIATNNKLRAYMLNISQSMISAGIKLRSFGGSGGSGKGTTGEGICILLKDAGAVQITTSKLIEKYSEEDSDLGDDLRSSIAKRNSTGGHALISDGPVFRVMSRGIQDAFQEGNRLIVLDGFPRNLLQAQVTAQTDSFRDIFKMYYLDANLDFCLQRAALRVEMTLAQGGTPRDDDRPEIVRNRYTEFKKRNGTLDGINLLKSYGVVHEIKAKFPLRKKLALALQNMGLHRDDYIAAMERLDDPEHPIAEFITRIEGAPKTTSGQVLVTA